MFFGIFLGIVIGAIWLYSCFNLDELDVSDVWWSRLIVGLLSYVFLGLFGSFVCEVVGWLFKNPNISSTFESVYLFIGISVGLLKSPLYPGLLKWQRCSVEAQKRKKHQEEMRQAAEKERLERNKAQARLLIAKKDFKQAYQFVDTNNLKKLPEFRQMDNTFKSKYQEALSFLKEKSYKKAIPILTELQSTPFDFGNKFIDDAKTAYDLQEAVEYMKSLKK